MIKDVISATAIANIRAVRTNYIKEGVVSGNLKLLEWDVWLFIKKRFGVLINFPNRHYKTH